MTDQQQLCEAGFVIVGGMGPDGCLWRAPGGDNILRQEDALALLRAESDSEDRP